MTNGDQPASPIVGSSGLITHIGNIDDKTSASGLTKREHFAAMALQGIMTSDVGISSSEYYAKIAVKTADALLKALEQ